jgi:hypothetical protein
MGKRIKTVLLAWMVMVPFVSLHSMKICDDVLIEIARFGEPELWEQLALSNKQFSRSVRVFKNYYFGSKDIPISGLSKINKNIFYAYMNYVDGYYANDFIKLVKTVDCDVIKNSFITASSNRFFEDYEVVI